MESTKIRFGILSTAKINDIVLEAISKSEQGIVTCVASRSLEKAE